MHVNIRRQLTRTYARANEQLEHTAADITAKKMSSAIIIRVQRKHHQLPATDYVCMYVKIRRHQHTCVHTRAHRPADVEGGEVGVISY